MTTLSKEDNTGYTHERSVRLCVCVCVCDDNDQGMIICAYLNSVRFLLALLHNLNYY